jgi:two-component system, chemotaxis family, sensor kinase CheA
MDQTKYKKLFIQEAESKIADLNKALLALEKNPDSTAQAAEAMRAAHTLKSSSAAMGYQQFSQLAHAMEDLLESVRQGKRELPAVSVDLLFKSTDMFSASLENIKKNKAEMQTGKFISKLNLGNVYLASKKSKFVNASSPDMPESGVDIINRQAIAPIESIQMGVTVLDSLMNLTEELLVSRMQFDEIMRQAEEGETAVSRETLLPAVENLGRLVGDLQYSVTQAHLVPLGQLFERFPRAVRDLAHGQNKQIDFSVLGADIELDRSVIEKLGEPLMHLLRNAVDHGVENKGNIILRASRQREKVVIEITNTGQAIDWVNVIKVAVKRGIIDEEQGDNFKLQIADFKLRKVNNKSKILNFKSEIVDLLFHPNLSTKEKVTETSGRGVGLSIVKKVIESLGGTVSVTAPEQGGTRFTLSIPLTLAVIQALLVRSAEQTFALPFAQVDRLVRLPFTQIKKAMNQEIAVVGEEDIPMLRLDRHFGLRQKTSSGLFLSEKETESATRQLQAELMVITKSEDTEPVGLVVDEVFSEQDIVVKPLQGALQQTSGFAGITLLGDGKPALILDIATLV